MEIVNNKLRIVVISFIVLLITFAFTGMSTVFAGEGRITVSGIDDLRKAVADAPEGQEQIIEMDGTIPVNQTIEIPANKKIRITTKNGTDVLEGVKGKYIFQVNEGGTLTLDGNITLKKGMAVNCAGSLTIEKATLTEASGAYHKGIVNVEGSKAVFIMNGGTITKNIISDTDSGAVRITAGAKGTINGGSLCNNEVKNQMSGTLLICNGGSCEMNRGEIKDNKAPKQMQSSGGVLVIGLNSEASKTKKGEEAHFTMNDGVISGNESPSGGGVYVYGGNAVYYGDFFSKAYFVMNGGTIKGNKATGYGDGSDLIGGGGGVYVECGGEFTMNNGKIVDNIAKGEGGGVATYDQFVSLAGKRSYSAYKGVAYLGREDLSKWPEFFPAAFVMNGGEVSRNHAISNADKGDMGCGGGIYCASSGVTLNAGKIEDNVADKQGGGVYVGSVPYVLHMYDCLITANEASVIGGGAWFCPTGEVKLYIHNGAAVYGNTAKGAADDLAVVRNGGNYRTTVADRILGGGKANWYRDGALDCSAILGNADGSVARYQQGSDKNVSVSNIKNSKEAFSLKSVPTEYAREQAKACAKLVITGNSSMRGGGLGSNGGIVLGKSYEAPQEIAVEKVWKTGEGNEDVKIPESITVWLVTEKGEKVEKVVLSKENDWKHSFEGLPSNIEYKVEEESQEHWIASYEEMETPAGDKVFTVTNTYQPPEPENPGQPTQPSGGENTTKTGDSAMPVLWAVLCGLALAGAVVLIVTKRRKE